MDELMLLKQSVFSAFSLFFCCVLFLSLPTLALSQNSSALFSEHVAFVTQIFVLALSIIVGFLFWNRRLIREVERRIQVESEMLKQKQQLTMAAQIAGMSSWELDLRTNELSLSDLFFEKLGTSSEKEGGYQLDLAEVLHRFCHPDDWQLFRNEYEFISKSMQFENRFEIRLVDSKNCIIPMLLEYRVLYDKEDKPCKLYGYLIDITKKKKNVQALNLAQAALESTADAILILEFSSGLITWGNSQACKLLQFTQVELASMSAFDFIEGFSQESLPEVQKQLKRKKSLRIELPIKIARKNTSSIEASLNLVSVEGGDFIVVYAHDITSRKNRNQQLKVSEERFSQSLEFAEIGIWDWDIRSNAFHWSNQSRLLFAHAKAQANMHYDDFIAKVHKSDREFVRQAMKLSLEQDVKCEFEFRILWPDGETRWLKSSGAVNRDNAGGAINMVGVLLDITEQKNSQDEIKLKSMELQSFNKAMVGRELRMIELKEEVNLLSEALNREPPYPQEWQQDAK